MCGEIYVNWWIDTITKLRFYNKDEALLNDASQFLKAVIKHRIIEEDHIVLATFIFYW